MKDNILETTSLESGEFYFELEKGFYGIKLDLSSIPKNYTVDGKYIQKISVPSKDEIIFTILPVISLEAVVKKNQKLIANKSLKVSYYENENFIREEPVKTNSEGKFYLFNLNYGKLIIKTEGLKEDFVIEIPEIPKNIVTNINLDNK